jgi:predicted kinase
MKQQKKMFISIGISGSGKSHYWKNIFLKDFPDVDNFLVKKGLNISDIIVCPDSIRIEVCGDVNSHKREGLVWYLVKERISQKLKKYNYVILDATNTVGSGRKFLKGYSTIHKTLIIFEPNIKLSLERITNDINSGVERSNVDEELLLRQFENFRNSVVNNQKWDGVWNESTKKRIEDNLLSQDYDAILFV